MAYMELKVGMNDKTYLHHISQRSDPREKKFIQSDQDVHVYGYDGYGKVDTRPGMGSRYYHT
jgi:hypothetical protein